MVWFTRLGADGALTVVVRVGGVEADAGRVFLAPLGGGRWRWAVSQRAVVRDGCSGRGLAAGQADAVRAVLRSVVAVAR